MSHLQSLAERHPVLGAPGLTPVGVLSALSAAAMAGFIFTSLANSRSPRLASILRGRAGDWWFALRTRAIVLLCSDEASYIAGTTPIPDGGFTLTVKGYAMPPERSSSRNRLGCGRSSNAWICVRISTILEATIYGQDQVFRFAAAAALGFTAYAGSAPANNANAANTAAKSAPAAPTMDALVTLEKSAYEAWKSKDAKFWDKFLSDKFVGYGSSGKLDKASAKKEYTGAGLRDQELRSVRRADEAAR